MICCKNLFTKDSKTRSVICLSWVKPLRLYILIAVAANVGYVLWHHGRINAVAILISLINLCICWVLLSECRQSESYHHRFKEMER